MLIKEEAGFIAILKIILYLSLLISMELNKLLLVHIVLLEDYVTMDKWEGLLVNKFLKHLNTIFSNSLKLPKETLVNMTMIFQFYQQLNNFSLKVAQQCLINKEDVHKLLLI